MWSCLPGFSPNCGSGWKELYLLEADAPTSVTPAAATREGQPAGSSTYAPYIDVHDVPIPASSPVPFGLHDATAFTADNTARRPDEGELALASSQQRLPNRSRHGHPSLPLQHEQDVSQQHHQMQQQPQPGGHLLDTAGEKLPAQPGVRLSPWERGLPMLGLGAMPAGQLPPADTPALSSLQAAALLASAAHTPRITSE